MRARHCQHHVGAVAGGDDGYPFGETLQTVLRGHARHEHTHHLAAQQRFVPVHQHSADGGTEVGDGRCHQQRLLGQHVDVGSEVLARLGDGVHLGRVAPVGHHRGGVGVLEGQFGQAQLDHLGDLRGSAVPGPHREHHRRAEVHRDAGVHAQLRRGGDVGVVGADDDHGVAAGGHRVVAVDDVGDGAVGVLVQPLIAHPDAVVVGEAGVAVRQQQLEDVVAVLTAGDRPEHPHLGHRGGQPMQDAQCDGGLAGVALGGGDVDGGGGARGGHLNSIP